MAAVAALAGASKQTIYHRHATKDLLFEAVVERSIDRFLLNAGGSVTGRTVEARIVNLAKMLVDAALDPTILPLMRTVIAEVSRFGGLAKRLDVHARQRVERFVLATGELDAVVDPALGPKMRAIAARQLIYLTVHAVVLRALLGADLAMLRREAGPMIKENVALFLRGLRT